MYKFTDQRQGEEIIQTLRRHKIVFLKLAGQLLLTLIIGVFVINGAWDFFDYLWPILVIIFAFILLIAGEIYYHWYLWYNDIYIITSERVIDVTQVDFFSRHVTEITWDKVQEITFQISGMLATMYNFGKIVIKTAGPEENILIDPVDKPQEVVKIISTIFNKYHEKIRSNNQNLQSEGGVNAK